MNFLSYLHVLKGILRMAVALSKNTQKNLETYFLLWLDETVNNSEDNVQAQRQLRTSINQLTSFDNDSDCEKYIHSVSKDDWIVLIVSGRLGQEFVPRIHHLPQISLIYIYCMEKMCHEQWAKPFYKVFFDRMTFLMSILSCCR